MPVFWSVNKQIRTDTVFHIIICAKHGTSTRAATPRAAKIWPRRAIFWPVPVTRYQRAPRRFCRSGVRGPRPSNHCTATSGKGSAAHGPASAVRGSAAPCFFRRSPVAVAGRRSGDRGRVRLLTRLVVRLLTRLVVRRRRAALHGACWSVRLG